MQTSQILTYREHSFYYSDEEKEVMQVVTRVGHVHIQSEMQWAWERPREDAFLLLYFATGEGRVIREGHSRDCYIRSTVILPLDKTMQIFFGKCELYYAVVEGKYQSWYVGEEGKVFNYQFSRYSEYFFYNLLANVDVYRELYCAAAASMVYRLYSDIYFFEKSFVGKAKDRNIEEAIAYIEMNYRQEITVKELAERSGYSVYHFNRKFKEILGVTPYHYVTQRRLIEAKNLLLSGDASIEQIALQCGFKNPVSFYQAFKQEFKLTPNMFKTKKKVRNDQEKELTSMKNEKMEQMIQLVQKGKVMEVNNLIKECLAEGIPATDILNDGLLAAMQCVADKWAAGKAFIPEVLIAARCLNSGMEILDPELTKEPVESKGKVVLGTVKTDLHNIGKNLVGLMLRTKGFEVIDIGVDVSVDQFVGAVKEHQPKYICMSALLTTSMPFMKDVVDKLKEEGLRDSVKVCIGGAPVTATYCQEIDADIYTGSAVELAEKLAAL